MFHVPRTWIQGAFVQLGELDRRLPRQDTVGATQHDRHSGEGGVERGGFFRKRDTGHVALLMAPKFRAESGMASVTGYGVKHPKFKNVTSIPMVNQLANMLAHGTDGPTTI